MITGFDRQSEDCRRAVDMVYPALMRKACAVSDTFLLVITDQPEMLSLRNDRVS